MSSERHLFVIGWSDPLFASRKNWPQDRLGCERQERDKKMQKAASPEPSVITSSDHPPRRDPGVGNHLRWITVASVCLAFASCYLREFVLPHVPILSWGDQMLYATDGARMIAGQAPYAGYFLMLTPGTDLVYA